VAVGAEIESDKVRYERIGAAAVLTITRAPRRNALDVESAEALLRGYRLFEADDDARMLVLTGEGDKAFCAGADLRAGTGFAARLHDPTGPIGFSRLQSPKPTIAAIRGWCIGAGMDLALWCDLRVAASDATFGFFERRWGVPSIDGYSQRLPRLIGLARALDMMLTGRPVDAAEARSMGLVSELTEPGAELERALEIAEEIAGYPQAGLLATRRAAIEGLDGSLREGLALEEALGAEALAQAEREARRFHADAARVIGDARRPAAPAFPPAA
jgi:enoyl-CoA hydratase